MPLLFYFPLIIWLGMPRCFGSRSDLSEPMIAVWRNTMPANVSAAALSRPVLLIALAGGVLLAVTFLLWAYYGTAVFFEMVRAGWVACF